MASINPTVLVDQFEGLADQQLCPNRVWHVCSLIQDWREKQSILQEILSGMFPMDALGHEDHSACSIDFCEFSNRNFAAVQQYHEPDNPEEKDQEKIAYNHKEKTVCQPIRGLFDANKLVRAIRSGKLTAWSLNGLSILEHPRPFMAISHVWSDGTGSGAGSSKELNGCLYRYFKRIAKRFQCEGIWWDTLCIPRDRAARSKALDTMNRNYEYARITLVHDRFLRNIPFDNPEKACLAVILSSWFTRGWTALELAKSRKVKIIFKNSIKDLDNDILSRVKDKYFAARVIKDLRCGQFFDVGDLLNALRPRY
ncbi:hypothetical protein M426DRAFT_69668, partial [Hypoxylon sp. CI-4A]